MKPTILSFVVLAGMLGTISAADAPASAPLAGEQIKWQVISGGGGKSTTPTMVLNSTVGQTAVGLTVAPTNRIHQGFWQSFSSGSCCNKPGDANNDGNTNVGDAVYMINFVFKGSAPPPCLQEGDANGDGARNVADAVRLINFVFKGGAPPICGP